MDGVSLKGGFMGTEEMRVGYETSVGRFRAKASTHDPEDDRSPMVQELVARLKFTAEALELGEKSVLDYGCGTGLALQWLSLHTTAGPVLGLDISEGAIRYARSRYKGIDFRLLDVEQEATDLCGRFDVVFCFEVLEHLANPRLALQHILHYLRPDGRFVATTPNQPVFSNGMEPSPINRTHIHEMNYSELQSLLDAHFEKVAIWGMRFRDPVRRREHRRLVQYSCDGSRTLGKLWWNSSLNRYYRWIWRGEVFRWLAGGRYHTWSAGDFEFVQSEIPETAVWFYAVCQNPRH